jgi:hypothetical protein
MFRSNRDVDKHVQDLLKKTTNENEVCAPFRVEKSTRRSTGFLILKFDLFGFFTIFARQLLYNLTATKALYLF